MAQKSQLPLVLGLTAAAGVGYYLYSAGGSPKAAEKRFEADVAQASAQAKSVLPGRTTEVRKQGEAAGAEAGAKVDNAADKARAELTKVESKLEQVRKEVGAEAVKGVEAFDRKVEEGAAKAKNGIWGWFGGK